MAKAIWQTAVVSLDSHKATDIKLLDVAAVTSIADWFLLASGGSANQVRSLCDYVEEALAKEGYHPLRTEGYQTGDWITLDYGDLMIHLFRREVRQFYDLERLWADAPAVDIEAYLIQENNGEENRV
ncbi:MAG: ribosome silencing factor [Clostridia bacterium]|nr:ribosome silencing factor [Clostridia bacterium]